MARFRRADATPPAEPDCIASWKAEASPGARGRRSRTSRMTSEPAIDPPAADPYDAVAYPGHSFSQTHPARLATIAHFHGMAPAPMAAMRVLELGCGRGGN